MNLKICATLWCLLAVAGTARGQAVFPVVNDPVEGRQKATAGESDLPASPDELDTRDDSTHLVSEHAAVEYGEEWATDSCDACCVSPWSFSFTQTADYVTSLALPITLTPANTLITAPGSGPAGSIGGLVDNLLGLDPLGPGGAVANPAATSVFPDDFQFQTTAVAQYLWTLADESTFSAAYTCYSSLHPQVKQIDLLSHGLLGRYARQLSERTVGTVEYNYTYYFLDDESYVTQNRGGASLLYRVSDVWDAKVAYDYTRADFLPLPLLDSNNHALRLEALRYFSNDRQDYLSAGYSYGRSDARLDPFSYKVNYAYLAARWLLGPDQRTEGYFLGSYAFYDFDTFDVVETTTIRRDKIWSLTGRLSRHLSDCFQVFGQYTYYIDDSNIARQHYHSSLVSVGGTVAW